MGFCLLFKFKKIIARRRNRSLDYSLSHLSEGQRSALKIFNYLLSNKKSHSIYSSVADNYYIEYKGIICKIHDVRLIITNGEYWYDVPMPYSIISNLRKKFVKNSESRKRILESKINNKLTSSIEKVYKEMVLL